MCQVPWKDEYAVIAHEEPDLAPDIAGHSTDVHRPGRTAHGHQGRDGDWLRCLPVLTRRVGAARTLRCRRRLCRLLTSATLKPFPSPVRTPDRTDQLRLLHHGPDAARAHGPAASSSHTTRTIYVPVRDCEVLGRQRYEPAGPSPSRVKSSGHAMEDS